MNKLLQILEQYPDEEFLVAVGFDEAIIGFESRSMRLVYSAEECIDILMGRGMDETEAIEHFDINVAGAFVGEKTPIFCICKFD